MDKVAQENWARYEYGKLRGHLDYLAQAIINNRFYMGGGRHWTDEERHQLEEVEKRLCLEFNECKPAINAALGYQIQNRLDISFKPRGGLADQAGADLLQKVVKQIADQNVLSWRETQVYGDGLIEARGFYDVRMDFNTVMSGEVRITDDDPRDIIPDPDAKSYDPEDLAGGWADVLHTRWLTLDEIEDSYGSDARKEVEASPLDDQSERDFGEMDNDLERGKFGNRQGFIGDGQWTIDDSTRRVRVIERQLHRNQLSRVVVVPRTGDVKLIADDTPREILGEWERLGYIITKRMMRRVRWSVSTYSTELHDDWSPYPWFTKIPYFCYFRRGETGALLDDAIGPQRALNKSASQFLHIVNGIANSGWTLEQGSLTNMTTEDLQDWGAKNGLVIEHKKGTEPPKKIQPNQVPSGLAEFMDRARSTIKESTVPDAMRGMGGQDQSGVALQHKQFASQQQLAVCLDNLSKTRHLVAGRILWCVQNYYSDERVFRITETDPKTGEKSTSELTVNVYDPASGNYLRDLTVGDYDVVISEQPMAVTFENSQFQQALDMKDKGVAIPDSVLVRHSTLTDKQEILEQMSQPQEPDPLTKAKIALTEAQIKNLTAQAVETAVKGIFEAIRTGQAVALSPTIAPIGDQILKSAGFEDQDAPPIVAAPGAAASSIPAIAAPPPPPESELQNTSPNLPPVPQQASKGLDSGIEGAGATT